jgi:hypothetical protein
MPQRRVKLVLKRIPRPAAPISAGASALNHELRNYAVKNKSVVKRALHFLPGLGIPELLGAFGKADEIADGLRGLLIEQTNDDVSQ